MPKLEQIVDPIAQANEPENAISLTEAGMMLEAQLKADPSLPIDSKNVRKMITLIGHAGEGKTAMIEQVLTRLGAEMAVFHMGSTIEEDNNGLPFIDQVKGITRLAKPEHVPCFSRVPISPSGLGVLVVEECLSGQMMHQNFLRSVIDRVWPNGDRMFPNWHVVGTTNPETSEYATVKAADRALASRLIFMLVRATSDEKMRYWAVHMQPTLPTIYNFLLAYHDVGNGVTISERDTNPEFNPIDCLDGRAWFNLADTVERSRAAGLPNRLIARSVRTHCGKEIETAFTDFLSKGSDPDEYPISHPRLLLGFNKDTGKYDDKDVIREEHARIGRWLSDEKKLPLVGVTKWGIKSFFRDENQLQRMKNDSQFYRLVLGNLCAFMLDMDKGGYAEHAADLCATVKDATPKTRDTFIRDVLNKIKGTSLEKKLISLHETYQEEKARAPEELVAVGD